MPTMPRTNDPAVIEHRLLDLAYTTDAVITAPLLAYYVPCRIEDAERVLDRLASEGRLRMDVDDDGAVKYELPNRQRVAPPQEIAGCAPQARWRQGRMALPQTALMRRDPEMMLEQRHAPNAAAAAVLSLVVPGAGQLYAGRPLSGVAWFALVSMGYVMLVIPGLLLHILCVASAAAAANTWRPSMA